MSQVTSKPKFTVGDVVRHQRYDYRGVVVGYDETCQASDEWYASNRTQSDREQPWYHVLVHGSTHSTYVAEENLTSDDCGEQIVHPLVKSFFGQFRKGRYIARAE